MIVTADQVIKVLDEELRTLALRRHLHPAFASAVDAALDDRLELMEARDAE